MTGYGENNLSRISLAHYYGVNPIMRFFKRFVTIQKDEMEHDLRLLMDRWMDNPKRKGNKKKRDYDDELLLQIRMLGFLLLLLLLPFSSISSIMNYTIIT